MRDPLVGVLSGVSQAANMTDTAQPLDGCKPALNHDTRILQVNSSRIGKVHFEDQRKSFLGEWSLELSETADATNLQEAASRIRGSDTPVAFPTETVYGLGADATRSTAVSGIYEVKRRPADNPLIVHISSLAQLRRLLCHDANISDPIDETSDPIPRVYRAVIDRFWPGPLTILLPLPKTSHLASQVTAGLPTFAVRMPSSFLALALINLTGVPLAAPSANASTRPSPTTAAHVLHDLSGRIDIILDGGPCEVGVESTVIDGLSNPPLILRPGEISLEMLRQCPGWEKVEVGYKDSPDGVPRAPGMKYKHYSPKARVILVERDLDAQILAEHWTSTNNIGCVATKTWSDTTFTRITRGSNHTHQSSCSTVDGSGTRSLLQAQYAANDSADVLQNESLQHLQCPAARLTRVSIDVTLQEGPLSVWIITLGSEVTRIARGLFSALRELDEKGVDVILVEGISDSEGGAAAAVMNRLRKAADQMES